MNYYAYFKAIHTLANERAKREALKVETLKRIDNQLRNGQSGQSRADISILLKGSSADKNIYSRLLPLVRSLNDTDLLIDTLLNCLTTDSADARYHFELGELYRCLSEPKRILLSYTNNVSLDFSDVPSNDEEIESAKFLRAAENKIAKTKITKINSLEYIALANLLVFSNKLEKAESLLRAVIILYPGCSSAFDNISFVLEKLGRKKESRIASGNANFIRQNYEKAIDDYFYALSLGADSLSVYETLAECLLEEQRFNELHEVIFRAPQKTERLYTLWIAYLQATNQTPRALEVVEFAHAAFPENKYFAYQARTILPVVYDNEYDILAHRIRVRSIIHQWSDQVLSQKAQMSIDDIKSTNFYLCYQNHADKEIQLNFGKTMCALMRDAIPQSNVNKKNKKHDRPRVGYISKFISWHSVGKLFLGWVDNHDYNKFDINVYHLGEKIDVISDQFAQASSSFVHLQDQRLDIICDRIKKDELDVLVHLDFGMSVLAAKVAATRLAPVQCLAWGHPVTSGLPTIDYFLSNELSEPPDGDDHYSEQLIRLPHVGVCVPQPPRLNASRTLDDFEISSKSNIYISPQSVFKYLPQYDDIFPAIAMRDPCAVFVFIERDTHALDVSNCFKKRLFKCFETNGLKGETHTKFLASQDFNDYLELLCLSHVYLDSIGFSGGLTSLEALGCGLPIVTMPGQFMRGRQSYAFLRRIGITETVVHSVGEYVAVAAKLGTDRGWRNKILEKQNKNLCKLYDDKECVKALETFYTNLIN